MRQGKSLMVLCLLVAVATVSLGHGTVLIIDETTNFMDSMKLEVLARLLVSQGFSVKAALGIPAEPPEGAPFDMVLLVPSTGPFIWLCTASPLQEGPEEGSPSALLQGLVGHLFGGEREVRTPAEDLWPWLLSAYFKSLGLLKG